MITTKNLQEDFTAGLSNFLSDYPTTGLFEPIRYLLGLRGKRIRPLLALSVSKAESSLTIDGLPAAMAVELFHNFTLMHDDIMDNAPLRRGNPTVHEKFSHNAAILSGDALFTAAYQALETAPTEHLPALLKLFSRTSMEVCQGQQLDLEFESLSDVTQDMYLEMIRLKTSVLLAASCAMGAICAGSSEARVQVWYEFGEKLGLAFQIQDDYLDTFGVESITGKQVGGDILADKKTFLFIHASASSELPETKYLDGDGKIAIISEQMQVRGSDLAAKNLMKRYSEAASSALQSLELDSNTQKWFEELLFSVTDRVS